MQTIVKIVKWGLIGIVSFSAVTVVCFIYIVASFDTDTFPENHGKTQFKLYVGSGTQQPLIVGFGGSEGGNAWASDYWKKQRDRFIEQGYAFLALGYFGMEGTPEDLDRISLDGIHQVILEASRHPQVNQDCIAVMGGSKGGELALLLGSYFDDIKAVVGIVPGHAVFAGITFAMTTSSFSYQSEPLAFVPVPWSAIPALVRGDFREAYYMMLENKSAVEKALIPVENINGPVLLVSATNDEMWPSSEMSESVIKKLGDQSFQYHYEHLVIEGGHAEPLNHFDQIMEFLNSHFMSENNTDCQRE